MRACVVGVVLGLLAGCTAAPTAPSAPEPEPPPRIRIVAGGDVMFGRWLSSGRYRAHDGSDLDLDALRARLEPASLALVNLETALCDADPPPDLQRALDAHRILLTAPTDRAARLAEWGVDVAVVANNHALDCGAEAFPETLAALERHGILAAGVVAEDHPLVGHTVWREGSNVVRLVAVSERPIPGARRDRAPRPAQLLSAQRLEKTLVDTLQALRAEHPGDLLVVSLHWGPELRSEPLPAQRALARALVEAGADVVLGHHAHVVQPVELIERDGRTAVIAYGLGNLHFDMQQPETRARGVLEIEIEPGERPTVRSATWVALD